MAGENRGEVVTDLFGDATVLPSGRRGRPAHRWSQSAEDRVIMGCAARCSDQEIADGLGISVPTLRKYYFSALKTRHIHRMRLELRQLEMLAKQMNKGNIGAIKELRKIMAARDRHLEAQRLRDLETDQAIPEGKKAQRAATARDLLNADPLLRGHGLPN